MSAAAPLPAKALGAYLKERRARVDPVALGYPRERRRTPGLRREEVAQRAHISATWYTWLEQGRGGAPSAEVLDRIAGALLLDEAAHEHLFLLALGHPRQVRYQPRSEQVSPRLRRVLDALGDSPAFIRTATWDLLAWNRAAAAVFGYDRLGDGERNILRRIFRDPRTRAAQLDWPGVARFAVAAFRSDAARAGASAQVQALVQELSQASPEFDRLWRDQDVLSHGEGSKRLRHPALGEIALEYTAFAVDGRPDLGMVVYVPASPEDAVRVSQLIAQVSSHG